MRIFGLIVVILLAAGLYFGLRTDGFGLFKPDYKQRMASSAHGILFDAENQQTEPTDAEVLSFQAALLKDAEAETQVNPDDLLLEIADNAIEALTGDGLTEPELVLFRAIRIRALALMLDPQIQSDYIWRGTYLQNKYKIDEATYKKPGFETNFSKFRKFFEDTGTNYARQCSAAGVPLPARYGEKSGLWTHQGNISTNNMIAPGKVAGVLTWVDTSRGGCVALTRDGGSTTGFICQDAASGNACFWDNLLVGSAQRINWSNTDRPLRDFQDGSNLKDDCTNCHRGSNVFLVAPDDDTWCKLLRGGRKNKAGKIDCTAITGPRAANFTLQVEGTQKQEPSGSGMLSYYTPLGGKPGAEWKNVAKAMSCSAACHLQPSDHQQFLGVSKKPDMSVGSPYGPKCGSECILP